MAKRTLPGLGLTGFWPSGANDWGDENDQNLLKLSVLVQGRVVSKGSALPGSPTQGDRYIVPDSDPVNPNAVAVFDDGMWVYLAPDAGWSLWVDDESSLARFNGTNWISGAGVVPISLQEETADYVLTDLDLIGNVVKKINLAGANTVTINPGLVGTEPVLVVQTGIGQTSFVAGPGVTISSSESNMSLRVRFSAATIIPNGPDSYILAGDLSA